MYEGFLISIFLFWVFRLWTVNNKSSFWDICILLGWFSSLVVQPIFDKLKPNCLLLLVFLFFELSVSFFKSVVESKANLPMFFVFHCFCFPFSVFSYFLLTLLIYFSVLVFIVATKSKNSKFELTFESSKHSNFYLRGW